MQIKRGIGERGNFRGANIQMKIENKLVKKYLDVLYNENEMACFSENLFGKNCYLPTEYNFNVHRFVTLNPCKGGRGNDFVTSYRSFLVEIDSKDISIEDQYLFFKSIEMPYSAITFSGNKSLHYVISLDRPLLDIESYKIVGEKLARAIGHQALDTGIVKKPATFTRAPMGIREDNGKLQKLFEVNGRVSRDFFNVWLDKRVPKEVMESLNNKKKFIPVNKNRETGTPSIFEIRTTEFNWLRNNDFPSGTRNDRWYRIARQFCDVGFSFDQAINTLEKYFHNDADFPYREWEGIIKGVFDKHTQ